MNEDLIIKQLLHLIAQKENLKEFSNWTNSDYEYLSDQILKKTNSYISDRTLRRLIEGYVLGKKKIRPTISTLNIISCFAGHENWHKFSRQSNIKTKSNRLKIIDNKKSLIIAFLVASAFLLSAIQLIYYYNKGSISAPNYKTGYPNTITLSIDKRPLFIRNLQVTATLDQSILKSLHVANIRLNNNKISIALKEPGLYQLNLKSKNKVLDSKRFFILNNEWTYSIYKEEKPVILHQKLIPQDGKAEIRTQNKEVNSRLMTDMSYFTKTNVLLDACKIEFRVRNYYFNELSCNLFKVSLYGMENNIKLYLADKSCYTQTKIKIGESRYDDKFQANSLLHRDYSEWTNISLKTENQHLLLYINKELSYKMNYTGTLDTLMGMKFWFLEGGAVDYIRFYDLADSLLFAEEFQPN